MNRWPREGKVKGLSEERGVTTELCAISATDVQEFRRRVLRPPKSEHAVYPGDDAPDTLHLGAFTGSALVAVATICRESIPSTSITTAWRLRGLATLNEFRRRGLGRRVLEGCVAHAVSQGGDVIWCTARYSALDFYRSAGFEERGEAFSLPEYTEESYFLMQRSIP